MQVELRGHESDARAAWALVGDTDHLNQVADNPRLAVEMRPDARGFPEVAGSMHGPGPVRHTYREIDSRWVSGRWFEQERSISGPILRRTHYRARLEPGSRGGVVPVVRLDIDFSNPITGAVGGAISKGAMKHWQAVLDGLPRPGAAAPPPGMRVIPGATEAALERWRSAGTGGPVVDRVRAFLQTARPRDLRMLRPLSLAERWGLPRRDVVRAFLAGTEVGALELYWTVRCPRCGAGVSEAEALSDLADHAGCPSCRIDFGNELDRNVEVLFAAHPAIRPPAGETFCTLFPAARPEVLALATLAPDSEEELEVELPPGRWSLGGGGGVPDAVVDVVEGGPDRLSWRADGDGGVLRVRPGPVRLGLANPGEARVRVQLSGDPDGGRWLSAAFVSTMPEYRRRFGAQALAPDARLGVRAVAVLFTDLVGSAAMYNQHGDATAFKLVHEHFGVLDAVLEQWGGARVKTIGDALMATFVDPADAVSAGLAMQADFQRWAARLGMDAPPGLRVGLHFGPAMAVHTDQAGLDYFGGTVNMAARCEGQAERGDVVWTDAVAASPGVDDRVAAWGGRAVPFTATIKGIPDPVALHRASVRLPSSSG
jgi:class 3 adenylate cyclase